MTIPKEQKEAITYLEENKEAILKAIAAYEERGVSYFEESYCTGIGDFLHTFNIEGKETSSACVEYYEAIEELGEEEYNRVSLVLSSWRYLLDLTHFKYIPIKALKHWIESVGNESWTERWKKEQELEEVSV